MATRFRSRAWRLFPKILARARRTGSWAKALAISTMKPTGLEGRLDALVNQSMNLLQNNTMIMTALARLVSDAGADRAKLQTQLDCMRLLLAGGPSRNSSATPIPIFAQPGAAPLDPELVLLGWLKPELSSHAAIDVGAHRGEYSDYLLRLGFKVFALEPHPQSFASLTERLGRADNFEAFNLAAGSQDGQAELLIPTDHSIARTYSDPSLYASLSAHSMPDDLVFENSVNVQVRSLSAMVADGLLPAEPAVLKIDVEGWEAEVLNGARALSPEIVVTEFWSEDSIFGKAGARNHPRTIYTKLAARGYRHLITFNRFHGTTEVTFLINHPDGLANSWGNLMLFRDIELFREALGWVETTLRRTYPGTPVQQGNA